MNLGVVSPNPTEGVWADLVGQVKAVEVLRRAISGEPNAMAHAWLITGPPGSGRSNAAKAFAAGLQCPQGGCGTCLVCRTTISGAHPDVRIVRTEKLSIGVDEIRELVRRAAMSPTNGSWQIIIVEDADRITERGADALLKSIEEPPARTVWLLCAPNSEDLIVTIRSRTREVRLSTPSNEAVAKLLVRRDGVDPVLAAQAARAAQGHIGRARALACDSEVMAERQKILQIPRSLISVEACLCAAQAMIDLTAAQAKKVTASLDEAERAELSLALGVGSKGARPRDASVALKELGDQQKLRTKRIQRDGLDRVLTELITWYRDILAIQLGTLSTDSASDELDLINFDQRVELGQAAASSSPEETLKRVDSLLAARVALENNVTPLLAMESLMLELARPGL